MRAAIFGFIGLLLAALPAQAMDFQRLRGGQCDTRVCVALTGTIDTSTPDAFRGFAGAQKLVEGAIVFLDSPGGDHVSGIALGREIRKRGFLTFVARQDGVSRTFVGAECASACVAAYLGGVQRGVGLKSRLGVHQLRVLAESSVQATAFNAQWYQGLAAAHFAEMGASPELIAAALKTAPGAIYWLSRRELRQFKVITLDTDVTATPAKAGPLDFWTATE